ncbi:MAG: NINE protein [Clostridia bacterium]|nr:NINE protein [Clostridia bacterium]
MYCRNCGEQMNENQAICLKCGVKTGVGERYCPNCGSKTDPNAAVCMSCGVAIKKTGESDLNGKDKMTIALVCFFLGGLGIHNFMMGETKKGIVKIVCSFLCGLGGILALIDFIRILTDKYVYDPEKLI